MERKPGEARNFIESITGRFKNGESIEDVISWLRKEDLVSSQERIEIFRIQKAHTTDTHPARKPGQKIVEWLLYPKDGVLTTRDFLLGRNKSPWIHTTNEYIGDIIPQSGDIAVILRVRKDFKVKGAAIYRAGV